MRHSKAAFAGSMALCASIAFAGVAGAQDEAPTPTDEAPVETEAPATTQAPEAPEPTQADPTLPDPTLPDPVEDPAPGGGIEIPTDDAPPADPFEILEDIELPGSLISSGTLSFTVAFTGDGGASCGGNIALSGGNMNVAYDEEGRIGGMYGLANTGTGTFGTLFIGLGPLPVGVGVISVSDANCEFDAIGAGSYSATASTAELSGVGIGIHPGSYDSGDYVDSFTIKASVGATNGPANLDLYRLRDFLLRERPGLTLPELPPAAPAPEPEQTPEG